MATHYADTVIIGGGTMGTAAGWALARQGTEVAVLEQFQHVHSFGSHGGRTRIFRHAYAEGERYVPWALEADRLWSEVQSHTDARFMHRIGCIDISAPGLHRAREARASAERYGIAHEWLTGADVKARWPIWNIPDDREVCYGPEAGFLDAGLALHALGTELVAAGGTLRTESPVTRWTADNDGARVETAGDTWITKRLIITAGAWSVHILEDLGIPLEVRRKPVFWFEVDDAHRELAEPDRMPVYISDDEHGEFYGFPHYQDAGIKVGMHSGGDPADPETVDRAVHDTDTRDDLVPFIQRNFRGVTGNVVGSTVCMYTMSPDEDFVIDRHPVHEHVVFATGFSGHGFKFAPVIGEYLATLATDPAAPVISDFAARRFATVPN